MYILGEIYIEVVIKKQKQNNILAYSMYSMWYLNVKIAHNALEQNIIIRHLFVQFYSFSQVHTYSAYTMFMLSK